MLPILKYKRAIKPKTNPVLANFFVRHKSIIIMKGKGRIKPNKNPHAKSEQFPSSTCVYLTYGTLGSALADLYLLNKELLNLRPLPLLPGGLRGLSRLRGLYILISDRIRS